MLNLEQRNELINQIVLQLQSEDPVIPEQASVFLPADWALALEATPSSERHELWLLIPETLRGEALSLMREEYRHELVRSLQRDEVLSATQNVSAEQAVNVIGQLSRSAMKEFMADTADDPQSLTIKAAMEYATTQVGRHATRDFLLLSHSDTLAQARELCRSAQWGQQQFIYVTDNRGRYLGKLVPTTIWSGDPSQSVGAVVEADGESIDDIESTENLATLFKRFKRNELPVLDTERRLIGLVFAKDVIVFVESFYEAQLAHAGNVSDEDLFAPVASSARQRAVWLGINLLTALLAAWVIGLFSATLDALVALAVLMPIVASMGGIAGSQSLTLTIRGLATKQLNGANISLLRDKEFKVVVINSVIWAVSVGTIAWLWFEQIPLAVVLAVAVIVNMIVAVLCGVGIPYLMHKMRIDPALAGSVVLTTVSDVVGFFVFLGLATVFLL